jgi:dTDP-4-dehydrorhamnose reductase
LNSRMSTDKLRQVFEGPGDMSKLQQLNKSWEEAVRAYVCDVVQDGLN